MKPIGSALLAAILFCIVPASIRSQAGVPQSGTPAINTSKWKTYLNEKDRFEVKYPDTWKVNASTGSGPEIIAISAPLRAGEARASVTLAIQANQNPKKLSIEEWFADQLLRLHAKPDSGGRMMVGGQPTMYMENTNSFGKRRDIFTLLHQTDVLSLSYARQDESDPICAAIVSSFRLVK